MRDAQTKIDRLDGVHSEHDTPVHCISLRSLRNTAFGVNISQQYYMPILSAGLCISTCFRSRQGMVWVKYVICLDIRFSTKPTSGSITMPSIY